MPMCLRSLRSHPEAICHGLRPAQIVVIVLEMSSTGTLVVNAVDPTITSAPEPESPTVKPDATVFPPLSRSSASAAVPLADGLTEIGKPSPVATLGSNRK